MNESDLLSHIAAEAGVNEETAKRVLATIVGDLATVVREGAERQRVLEVPPYFDRYVTTEIGRLGDQISALRREMDRRFEEVNRRFSELAQEMDRRFSEFAQEMDRRFEEVDRRFEQINGRFDRLERWFFALGVPMILGILAIIFKVFFRP